jgi:hypothetical protein
MPINIYLEYALASALTSRWFLSLRRTVAENRSLPTVLGSTQANGPHTFQSLHPIDPLRPGRASVHFKRQEARLSFKGAPAGNEATIIGLDGIGNGHSEAVTTAKGIKFDEHDLRNDSSDGLEEFPMEVMKTGGHAR